MVAGRKRFRAGLPGRLTPAAHKAPAPMTADAGARIPTTRHPLADHRPSRAGSHADQAVWHDPAPRDQPRPGIPATCPSSRRDQSPMPAFASQRRDRCQGRRRCGQLTVVLNDSPPRRITRSGRPAIHTPSHPRQRRSMISRAPSRTVITMRNHAQVRGPRFGAPEAGPGPGIGWPVVGAERSARSAFAARWAAQAIPCAFARRSGTARQGALA